jgi:hypothetical protein
MWSSLALTLISIVAVATGQDTPTVTGVLDGPRTPVFATPQQSCSPNDIPDAMARAFRDDQGVIHFTTAATILYPSLGPNLENLIHSCNPAFVSQQDGNPADYNDEIWLDSFYTLDGKTIAALSHTEYHGWSFTGECNSQNISLCEYDSDTYHQSDDGGDHFSSPQVPGNFLAGVPYTYEVDNGEVGYSVDSNIVPYNGYYYAIATDDGSWPLGCSGSRGNPCLVPSGGAPIRTTNVFDPTSWRGWDGSDFAVSFVDPYLGPVAHPEQHVYSPVMYMEYVNGLNLYQPSNVLVATLWDYWDNALGPPGMYFTTTTDLIHWTKPTLVITFEKIKQGQPKGNYLYAYFSLIDPVAPDLSFSTVSTSPYLYYVRINIDNIYDRVVFRQRLTLSSSE